MNVRKKLFHFAKKIIYQRNLLTYQWRGYKPWGRGYYEHKWNVIEQTFGNKKLMEAFSQKGTLPEQFGHRIDERVVEYPWLITSLPSTPAKLLDAGSALNFEKILSHPKLENKKISIVTLHPESNCFWNKGVSYMFEDLRHLPITSDTFDIITCISTLEHVGMDNTKIYTTDSMFKEDKTEDYLTAATELKRVLKTGGTLYLTMPFGKYQHFDFFQQFNLDMVSKLTTLFGIENSALTFYKYTDGGWNISDAEECAPAKYTPADEAKVNPSLSAAASAVVCMTLTK